MVGAGSSGRLKYDRMSRIVILALTHSRYSKLTSHKDQSIKDAIEYVAQQFEHLDILVNNAAIGGLSIPDIRTQLQLLMEANVTSLTVVANSFRPLLLKSGNLYSVYVDSGTRTLLRNMIQRSREHTSIGKGGVVHIR